MSNRLKNQSSPYLLQHAENPVDWYPWCKEAFEKAEREEKPIFLSIGYSTCHWCHVMAHESFENREIAEILNRYFVSVKVDREERADIDSVYMAACQTFSGSGGWPMSIFMTAEQKPFFAGTYFPPVSRYGMVGFRDLLLSIAKKWKKERENLLASADYLTRQIYVNDKGGGLCEAIDSSLPERAADLFIRSFDKKYGGFGQAPKFPTPHNLIFLMLYAHLNKRKELFTLAEITLYQMRRGGLFDHIGHGFSRYSTDNYYLVPHFEKMLYDNALLIIAYSAAYTVSKDKNFLDTAEKTAEYILREMTGNDGEFYSAQDADSEGEEGKFYVWDYEEVCRVLGMEKGREFCEYFGITKEGNFEGGNIPNLLNGNEISDAFEEERKTLYHYRQSRFSLHLDDKVLTAWNALMIYALSILYRVSGKRQYLQTAEKAQEFMETNLADEKFLYVSCRNKARSVKGFLDEYAYETAALIALYEATAKTAYLEKAETFCRKAMEQFSDENGGYFLYGAQNSQLVARPKETYDGALPSGNSVMAYCLVRLHQLTSLEEYREAAEKQLAFLSGEAAHYPAGHSMFLMALLYYLNPPPWITAVLSKEDSAERIMPQLPLFADIKILERETEGYKLLNGRTTYYVCKNHACLPAANQIE